MHVEIVFDLLGYVFAFIGVLASVYKAADAWLSIRRFKWGDVDRLASKILRQIDEDKFIPDVIVGIGRGGSVLGAILSGNIDVPHKKRNIPILGVDRLYEWRGGARFEVKNEMVDFGPLKGKKVLLVAGDVLTGSTMKFFLRQLRDAGAAEVRTACLVKGVTAAYNPDYFGKEIPADFRMPWMYEKYVRDSRHPTQE